ncbi:pilin N-terminal domain-containing protein [Lacticaseibacillus thailandensis]|uniref:pilin N-terminal domain-containing protein n=1 Tax=Lacticaseibacillus thailandensis TaxID=381741 RepID=UPI0006CF733B|nr:pilin N-terminal domain-containing protein [Lacticaseibacillus thailandensis]
MKKITIVRGLLALGLALGLVSTILTAGTNQPAIPVVAATAEDNTSDRTITLHKYTESATPTSAQATGTTADASNVPADSKPLQGIQFRVERVDKVAGKPLDASDSSTYAVDNSFPAKTTTTGSDGKAQLTVGTGKDADGYYLVTEVASKLVATATAPFIVHLPQTTKNASTGDMTLLYDVNVYPKNKVDDNAVALNPEKFVTNDTSGTGTTATSVMQGALPFGTW